MEDRTMKRTYQKPETEVVAVAVAQMIATSGFAKSLNTSGGNGNSALAPQLGFDEEEDIDFDF
jgi:hypothetical protein